MRFWHLGARPVARRGTYQAIERGLWALAPLLVLLFALSVPAMRRGERQAEADYHRRAAAENASYCKKWGIPPDSANFAACLRDLMGIRAVTEWRAEAMAVNDF